MKKKKIFLEIFSLLCIAAIFFTIYVFVELRSSKLCVIGSGVVLLITAYLLIDFILDTRSDKSEGSGVSNSLNDAVIARLDELESVEKAIYTATKRNGSDASSLLGSLTSALENIENQLSAVASSLAPDADLSVNVRRLLSAEQSVHEIIQYIRQDQQNGVKMGIKYNKENARQLAEINNTNTDKLIEKLEALEEALRSGITVAGTAERTIPVAEPPSAVPGLDLSGIELPDIDVPENAEGLEDLMSDDDLQKLLDSIPDSTEEAAPAAGPSLEDLMSGDPNKALTPDEIAAMFAAAAGK